MKKSLLSLAIIFLILTGSLFAQNPGVVNPEINPNPYEVGGSGTAQFTFQSTTIPIPSSTFEVTINISFGNILPTGPPSGAGAALFSWSQPNGANTYEGVQITTIPGQGSPIPIPFQADIIFNVDVTGNEGDPAGFLVQLANTAGLDQNSTDDDLAQFFTPILVAPLPVELLSFTGRKVDKVVQLDWTTVTEQNNEGFEIHKSSDGQDWYIIGWVDGNGTVTRNIDYSYIDKSPFIGENYYRLQQFDHDGRSEFSNTIIVKNLGKEAAINILPNPSSGPFTVAVENPNNEKMRVTLYDSAGQLIWKSALIEDKKMWRKDFDLKQKEMYFISVEIGKEVISEKILIIDRA